MLSNQPPPLPCPPCPAAEEGGLSLEYEAELIALPIREDKIRELSHNNLCTLVH